MPITALPALDRTAVSFKTDVDTFFGTQLPTFSTQAEAARVEVVTKEASAVASAVAAAASQTAAAASQTAAAGSQSAAAGSQSAAAGSASTATTQSGISVAKAGEASASAVAAAASAATINLTAPGPIGGTTSATGSFTTLNSALTGASSLNHKLFNSTVGGEINIQFNTTGTLIGQNDRAYIASDADNGGSGYGGRLKFGVRNNANVFGHVVTVTADLCTVTGQQIVNASGTDAIVKLSRTGTSVGAGWLGANDAHSLVVYNGDLSISRQFKITQNAVADGATLSSTGLAVTGSITPGSFTVATRPAHGAGKMIYVSDGGAGAVFQGSNGSAWVNLG